MSNVHHLPADRQSIIAEISARHDAARAALNRQFAPQLANLDQARAAWADLQKTIDAGREAAERIQAQHDALVAAGGRSAFA